MGINQLRLVGNKTDLESQLKNWITRYRARDPWSARSIPHMLRERERGREGERGEKERHADRQAYIHIERLDRQTDREIQQTHTKAQSLCIRGSREDIAPPPPTPPTPVKSHSYTPKIQTIFTLMLSRATKAIKWSFAGGPMTARLCGIWILSPLIN